MTNHDSYFAPPGYPLQETRLTIWRQQNPRAFFYLRYSHSQPPAEITRESMSQA